MAARRARGIGSRTMAIAERRASLGRLLIALFVARIVVTMTEIIESEVTLWSALITAAIGLEAWRAWRVSRVAPSGAVELPDTAWNRVLSPLERRGPAVLYVLTAVYALAYAVLLVAGVAREDLLAVAQISREVVTLVFLGVLLAGYLSVRPTLGNRPPKASS